MIDAFARAQAVFRSDIGNSFFNYGPTVPTADNRPFPWYNTVEHRWYDWSTVYGYWIAENLPAGPNGKREIWTGPVDGTAQGLWSYDGGDGTDPAINPPQGVTGAMWMVDIALSGRFPLGVGTLPSGLAVAVTNTGGEEKHTLALTEIPSHTHPLIGNLSDPSNREQAVVVPIPNDNPGFPDTNAQTGATGGNPASTPTPNATDPHQNMPPFYGVYFIQRSPRIYYAIAG